MRDVAFLGIFDGHGGNVTKNKYMVCYKHCHYHYPAIIIAGKPVVLVVPALYWRLPVATNATK